jgi:hypothetical protein
VVTNTHKKEGKEIKKRRKEIINIQNCNEQERLKLEIKRWQTMRKQFMKIINNLHPLRYSGLIAHRLCSKSVTGWFHKVCKFFEVSQIFRKLTDCFTGT